MCAGRPHAPPPPPPAVLHPRRLRHVLGVVRGLDVTGYGASVGLGEAPRRTRRTGGSSPLAAYHT